MKKDGPNKGREFYKCAKQPPCEQFFAWADASGQTTSSGGSRTNTASTSRGGFQNPPRNGGNNADQPGEKNIFQYFSASTKYGCEMESFFLQVSTRKKYFIELKSTQVTKCNAFPIHLAWS